MKGYVRTRGDARQLAIYVGLDNRKRRQYVYETGDWEPALGGDNAMQASRVRPGLVPGELVEVRRPGDVSRPVTP